MDYTCGTCGEVIPRELMIIIPHTEKHIIDEISKKHPEWSGSDGICKKCYEYYKKEMGK